MELKADEELREREDLLLARTRRRSDSGRRSACSHLPGTRRGGEASFEVVDQPDHHVLE